MLAQVGRSYPYLDMGTLKYQSDKSRCVSTAARHRPLRPAAALPVAVLARACFEPNGGISWMGMLVRSATCMYQWPYYASMHAGGRTESC